MGTPRLVWSIVGVGVGVGVAVACTPSEPPTAVESAALVVGAEIDLGPTELGPAFGTQLQGTVVADGDGYVAVWTDMRESVGTLPVPEARAFFSRLSVDGAVLDTTGLPLSSPA